MQATVVKKVDFAHDMRKGYESIQYVLLWVYRHQPEPWAMSELNSAPMNVCMARVRTPPHCVLLQYHQKGNAELYARTLTAMHVHRTRIPTRAGTRRPVCCGSKFQRMRCYLKVRINMRMPGSPTVFLEHRDCMNASSPNAQALYLNGCLPVHLHV